MEGGFESRCVCPGSSNCWPLPSMSPSTPHCCLYWDKSTQIWGLVVPLDLEIHLICAGCLPAHTHTHTHARTHTHIRASPVAQWWRICLPMKDTWVRSLGLEDPLEKEMAIHSSILAWRIPWIDGIRKCSSFILSRVAIQFSQHHLLKRLSFLYCVFLPPLSKKRYP